MADSWKPDDKALEAAFENPEEFDVNQSAIEDSRGPIEPKTDGEVDRSKGKGCRSSAPGRPHDYEVQQRGIMAWIIQPSNAVTGIQLFEYQLLAY